MDLPLFVLILRELSSKGKWQPYCLQASEFLILAISDCNYFSGKILQKALPF
jgi:hypothetical protein